jgi:hypothetical protein
MLNLDQQFALYKRIEKARGTTDFCGRLIHYTKLATLEKILGTKTLWLGRLSDMNDFREVDHFLDGILEAIPTLIPGRPAASVADFLNLQREVLRKNTYASSWCEYPEERKDGVLSMWGRYAPAPEGIGIVIDSAQFQPSALAPQNLGFFLNVAKMAYVADGEVRSFAARLLDKVSTVLPVRDLDPRLTIGSLLAQATCVKHDGFEEEKEVRFLSIGGFVMTEEAMGIPARNFPSLAKNAVSGREFLAVPLENYPNHEIDLSIDKLLRGVVVAPGPDRDLRIENTRAVLRRHGYAHVPVIASGIPLR